MLCQVIVNLMDRRKIHQYLEKNEVGEELTGYFLLPEDDIEEDDEEDGDAESFPVTTID